MIKQKTTTIFLFNLVLVISLFYGCNTNNPPGQSTTSQTQTATAPETQQPDVMIAAPALDWKMPDPAAPYSIVTLWGNFNRGQAGILLSLPGGFKGPAHAHTADYRAVIVSGTWVHVVTETSAGKGIKLGPGSYYTQRANQLHEDECVSVEPCVFFRFTESDYKTYTPSDPTPR